MNSPYAKAIYAAVSTLLTGLAVAATDGLTLVEGIGVTASVVIVVGGVFGLTNEPLPADVP